MVILRKLRKARKLARLGFRDLSLYLGADLWHGGLAKLGLSVRQSVYRLRAQSSAWPLQMRANSSDRKVCCMIHVDREYAPLNDMEGVRLIVDCGANVGYASAYFSSHFPQARVIAVEPDDQKFEALRRNLVIELHDGECRRVFFQALSSYTYDLSESGELTICRNLRPAA